MIEIYWNRAVGNGKEIFKFPEDEKLLAEIFLKIKRKDFSFLGDFYFKYGPEIVFKGDIANQTLQKALIDYGKLLLISMEKNELKIMESIKFYHELEKIINDYKMHLLGWYDIVDPFSKFHIPEDKIIKKLEELDKNSEEGMFLSKLKNNYDNLLELKTYIENYLESLMKKTCPNLTEIAGPILGAELILLSNGIKNLAQSPAGRIQILGAGKSFYLSRKKNVPGPKHGIIFKHPFVHNSKTRGKNARILAGKIAIATRIDFYSGKLDNDFIESTKRYFNKNNQ